MRGYFKRVWHGDPQALRHIHGWLTVAWLAFAVPVLLVPGWKESVALLVFISIYANVAGHWAAMQAASAELKVDES